MDSSFKKIVFFLNFILLQILSLHFQKFCKICKVLFGEEWMGFGFMIRNIIMMISVWYLNFPPTSIYFIDVQWVMC